MRIKLSAAALLVAAVSLVPPLVFAQEPTSVAPSSSLEGTIVATVNVQDISLIKREKNVFTIGFNLTNGTGIQPNVVYAVELMKKESGGFFPIERQLYENDVLTLKENSSVSKIVSYTVPEYLKGEYYLGVSVRNRDALPLGSVLLTELPINLAGTRESLKTDPASCYLTIKDEKSKQKYTILQGVDIAKDEVLVGHCSLTSAFSSKQTVTPNIETRYRSPFGKIINAEKRDSVAISPNETIDFSFSLTNPSEPQAYDSILTFTDAKGQVVASPIDFHFVIQGESATIQNLTVDKDSYKAGETAKVSFFWTGIANNFVNSRAGYKKFLGNLSFEFSLVDGDGKACADPLRQSLKDDGSNLIRSISIPVTKDCRNPVVSAKIADPKGKTLVSNAYAFKSASVLPDIVVVFAYLFIVLLLILVSGFLFRKLLKKNKTNAAKTLLFFLITACLFGGGHHASANTATWTVYPTSWGSDPDHYITVTAEYNLNKSVYSPGEAVIGSYKLISAICNNGVDVTVGTYLESYFQLFKHIAGGGDVPTNPVWFPAIYAGTTYTAQIPAQTQGSSASISYFAGFFTSVDVYVDGSLLQSFNLSAPFVYYNVATPVNGAQFITFLNLPSTMIAGSRLSVTLQMLNTGNTTWTEAEQYSLGSQNPQDNSTWGVARVYIPAGEQIAPGQYKYFSIDITAPSTPGTYNFQWRMLRENVEWFGDYTANSPITVVAGPACSATPGICSSGTASEDSGVTSCGTTRTWNCTSGGTTIACSYNNPPCPVAGTPPTLCTIGTVSGDNGATACATTRTWSCTSGGSTVSSSYAYPACAAAACGTSNGLQYYSTAVRPSAAPAGTTAITAAQLCASPSVLSGSSPTFSGTNTTVAATWTCKNGTVTTTCTAQRYKKPTITSFTAAQPKVPPGERPQLSWASSDASSCTGLPCMNSLWCGLTSTSGTNVPQTAITAAKTYQLTCTNTPGESVLSSQITVGIVTPPSTPVITGPSQMTVNVPQTYTIFGSDTNTPLQQVRYGIDYKGGANNSWQSVAYGNGLFVAVSSAGDRVMTSPDGITWTIRSAAGNDDTWTSVTFGNGLFVAVGSGASGDHVMTSPDGITWTARTAAGNNDTWNDITYGKGLFVAVGSGSDRAMTSPDGITWTVRTTPSYPWTGVTYLSSASIFVAVGTGGVFGKYAMSSPDGITWTGRTASGYAWQEVAYGNNTAVAIQNGTSNNHATVSTDGTTWTNKTAAGDNDGWNDITYGKGLFVAVGSSGDRVMTSANGSTWTAITSVAGNDDSWNGVAYGNGIFVAVGSGPDKVMTSSDGSTWTVRTPGFSYSTDGTMDLWLGTGELWYPATSPVTYVSSGTSKSFTLVFPETGTYTVQGTVQNVTGLNSTVYTKTITVIAVPNVNGTCPLLATNVAYTGATTPVTGTCNTGTPSPATAQTLGIYGGSTVIWDCLGSGTGTDATGCVATRSVSPPNAPTIMPVSVTGYINENQTYNFVGIDTNLTKQNVRYEIDYKNNTTGAYVPDGVADVVTSYTTNPAATGLDASIMWTTVGTYTLKARTQNASSLYSGWTSQSVTLGIRPISGSSNPTECNKNYPPTATTFDGALCLTGTPYATNSSGTLITPAAAPTMPAQGGTIYWRCFGSNGGIDSSTCSTVRTSVTCGPAINTPRTTKPTTGVCSDGSSGVWTDPAWGDSTGTSGFFKWKCGATQCQVKKTQINYGED